MKNLNLIKEKITYLLSKIKDYIKKSFPIWKQNFSKHLLLYTVIIFLIFMIYITHLSLNEYKNISDAKDYAELISNTIKDLSLAFIPIITVFINSNMQKNTFIHEEKIKKMEFESENIPKYEAQKINVLEDFVEQAKNYFCDKTENNFKKYQKMYFKFLIYFPDYDSKDKIKKVNFIITDNSDNFTPEVVDEQLTIFITEIATNLNLNKKH